MTNEGDYMDYSIARGQGGDGHGAVPAGMAWLTVMLFAGIFLAMALVGWLIG